jgi:hypothetical protein
MTCASFLLGYLHPVRILLEAKVEPYLVRVDFLRKNGTIFGGDAPRSSPRG